MGKHVNGSYWPVVLVVASFLLPAGLPALSAGEDLRDRNGTGREGTDAPWPAFHGDAGRTGDCVGYAPDNNNLIWSNGTGANCYGSPAVAGQRVFIGSTGGTMYCFNASTGERLWTFATGGAIHSTPWVDIGSDRLFFGSHDQYVYCLNASDGSRAWRARLGGLVTSSPLLYADKVYIGCGDWYFGQPDGYLYCLHASNGTEAWRAADAGSAASPAVSDGRLFSTGADGLVCLDPDTGSRQWSMLTGYDGFGSPAAANGKVYLALMNGHVQCYNARTGMKIWERISGYSESSSTPAISNGSVYVCVDGGSPMGGLLKLDAADGTVTWTYGVQGSPWGSPAVAGDNVYFANDRTVECVRASDHSQVWSHQGAAGDPYGIGSSPAIAYGHLYIGGAEAKVYCIGLSEPNRPPAAVTLSPPSEIRETSMVLKWTGCADADFSRYELHKSTEAGFVPGPLTLVQPGGNISDPGWLSLNVSGLDHSTRYRFKLRVWDQGFPPMCNDSNEVEGTTLTPNGAPAAVTLFPAGDITPFSMRISWSQNNDGDFGRYEVHRGTAKGFQPATSTLALTIRDAGENSTVVWGLKPWTAYFFKIRVLDNGTPPLRNDSNEIEARTGNTRPVAVTLYEPQMGATSADLGWSTSVDDDFASYEVHVSQDGSFTPGKATLVAGIGNRLTTDHSVPGLRLARTYHFIVRVVDQGGMFNDSGEVFGLTANTLPKAVITSPSDGDSFDTRTPVDFNGSASSDQDLDPLSFCWVSSVDGFLSSSAAFTRPLSEGSHRISLFVNDGHGHNLSARVSVTVNKAPNRRPAVTVYSPANNDRVSGVVTFAGTAEDIDGNGTLRSVELKIGRAGWEEAEGLGEWTCSWNASGVANGRVKVLIRAFDGELYSAEAALTLTVSNVLINRKPTVEITGPLMTRLSKTAVVTGTANDPEGRVARVELSLNGGGWRTVTGTDAWTCLLDTTQLRNGKHCLQVRAYDGQDYSEPATLNFTVSNGIATTTSGPAMPLLGGTVLVIIIAVVAVAVLLTRRRKGRGAGRRVPLYKNRTKLDI